MIEDKKVSGIIDWESSGFFPAYWEWVTLKRSAESQKPDDSWFYFLAKRLGSSENAHWEGMWQLEQLHKALGQYAQWALTPEDRERNRTRGWAKVTEILGLDCGVAPWWLEKRDKRRC